MTRRRKFRKKHRKTGCLTAVLTIVLIVMLAAAVDLYLSGNEEVNLFDREVIAGQIRQLLGEEKVAYQEVHVEEKEAAQKYYYQLLNEKEQLAYREILQGIRDESDQIYIHLNDAKRGNELFQLVLKDYPDIFWCEGTSTTTAYSGKESYSMLSPGYQYTGEERISRQAQIDQIVTKWLSGISVDASDYDKILYVYEQIVNQVDYDDSSADDQNICSVFLEQRSVCAGYSKAMQYLLERLNVMCTYVTGTAFTGESHAWNLVQCNGDYYYVDVTWGDPVFQEREGEADNRTVARDNISYDYMCCDDTELFRTHTPDGDVKLPACTKMDANYYVVNGMYETEYRSDLALKRMNEAIAAGEEQVVLKYSTPEVYAQARQDILEHQIQFAAENLARWYGLFEVRYSYMDDDRLNKLTIFWNYD